MDSCSTRNALGNVGDRSLLLQPNLLTYRAGASSWKTTKRIIIPCSS
ncbi:MAG: hypothetical protein ACFFC7_12270 [Candidatus Hermodarchaeota archaeon]